MAPPDPIVAPPADNDGSSSSQSKRRRLLLHEAGKASASASASQQPSSSNDTTTPQQGLGLVLAPGFESSDLRLLEATPEVVAALCGGSNSNEVRVVGSEAGAAAALVTRDATFELCRVETSNMLLLVPPLAPGAAQGEAVGHAAFHYEVRVGRA